jgi:hypothetical protein
VEQDFFHTGLSETNAAADDFMIVTLFLEIHNVNIDLFDENRAENAGEKVCLRGKRSRI